MLRKPRPIVALALAVLFAFGAVGQVLAFSQVQPEMSSVGGMDQAASASSGVEQPMDCCDEAMDARTCAFACAGTIAVLTDSTKLPLRRSADKLVAATREALTERIVAPDPDPPRPRALS